MAKKKSANKKAVSRQATDESVRKKKAVKKTAGNGPAKKRTRKAAPKHVDKKFEVPTSIQWRKETTRRSVLSKLPLVVSVKFAFEMAAQEVVAIGEEGIKMPVNHLKVLVSAYEKAMLLDPPVTAAKKKEPEQKYSQGQLREIATLVARGKIKRIDGHWVKLTGAIQKLYYNNNCSFTYLVNDTQFCYEYRSIRHALAIVASEDPSQVKIWNSATSAAKAISPDYFWDRQVKMLASLVGVFETFGNIVEFNEQNVVNDWLEERGMELLLFPQIALTV